MSSRVPFDLYVEQDATTTRLMLHVEGDVPLALVQYQRDLINLADSLTVINLTAAAKPKPGEHHVPLTMHYDPPPPPRINFKGYG